MVAQLWCLPDTRGIEMDTRLAEPMAQLLFAWIETGQQAARDREYYQGLVRSIGEQFGEAAYRADDGTRMEDVICAKVPDLVAAVLRSWKR